MAVPLVLVDLLHRYGRIPTKGRSFREIEDLSELGSFISIETVDAKVGERGNDGVIRVPGEIGWEVGVKRKHGYLGALSGKGLHSVFRDRKGG